MSCLSYLEKMLNKHWPLPPPPSEPEIEWLPVVRVGRTVPFGYKQDPDDKDILLPIPDELDLFEKAKLLLKEYSFREVASWLSDNSGRSISHVGLYKRVKIEKRRKKEATTANFYAERYKEAWEKAKALEAKLGGAGTYTYSS